MRQNIIFCAVVFASALILTSCTKGAHRSDPTSLTMGIPFEPHTLNPLLEEGTISATIGPVIFSYLLTIDSNGRLQPDLAEAIPSRRNGGVSADGLTVTYHLRHGVKWQDGQPLTAADVVYSYGLVMNPSINVPSRTDYDEIESVSAPDLYTVRVRLKRRFSPLFSNFFAPDNNYPVLPKHVLVHERDVNHAAFNTMPVGSGPYRVEEWSHGDYIRFAANPLYFRGAPAIAHLTMKSVPIVSTLYEQVRTGELDSAFVTQAQYAHDFHPIPGVRASRVDAGGAALLIFNVASSPLNDVRVRRALAQGIDYARIVHDASRGTESTRNAPAGLFGATYDPSVKQLPFDVTRAKALLDEAGWRDGPGGVRSRDGVPLELDYAYDLQEAEGTDFGVLLQQAMRTLGVRLAMRGYSTQIFTAPAHIGGPLLGGKFEMSFVQLTGPTDPDLSWFFGCDQMPPNGFNISRFCDSQVSAADAASVASYDWNERRRQSIVIQRRLAEEVPLIALWQQGHVAVHIDSLIGVDPAPTSSVWNVGTWRIQHSGDAQGN